jgi:hypothetical protein
MKIRPETTSTWARERNSRRLRFSDFSDAVFVRHAGMLALLADGMGGMALKKEARQRARIRLLSGSLLPKKT